MNKPVSPASAIRGEEHWTNKGSDVRLFLWNKHAGDPSGPAGRILFVHGSSMASQPTFDLQVPGRPRRWITSPRRATTPGASTWRVTGDRRRTATTTRHLVRRRRLLRGRDLYREAAGQEAALGLRDFLGRAARRLVRAAPSRDGGAARVRRHGVDRRGLADLGRAQQAAAGIPREELPPDRSQIRALDLRARSSRHRRRQRDRGVCGRHPQARQFDPERNLCRHVRQSAGLSIRRRSLCRP